MCDKDNQFLRIPQTQKKNPKEIDAIFLKMLGKSIERHLKALPSPSNRLTDNKEQHIEAFQECIRKCSNTLKTYRETALKINPAAFWRYKWGLDKHEDILLHFDLCCLYATTMAEDAVSDYMKNKLTWTGTNLKLVNIFMRFYEARPNVYGVGQPRF